MYMSVCRMKFIKYISLIIKAWKKNFVNVIHLSPIRLSSYSFNLMSYSFLFKKYVSIFFMIYFLSQRLLSTFGLFVSLIMFYLGMSRSQTLIQQIQQQKHVQFHLSLYQLLFCLSYYKTLNFLNLTQMKHIFVFVNIFLYTSFVSIGYTKQSVSVNNCLAFLLQVSSIYNCNESHTLRFYLNLICRYPHMLVY